MIRLAAVEDAYLVHRVTMSVFEEYRDIDISSSALSETVDSVRELLADHKEKSILYMQNDTPIGSARFK